MNPVMRLIRKKQLQRRLRLRGRLAADTAVVGSAATARSSDGGSVRGQALADGCEMTPEGVEATATSGDYSIQSNGGAATVVEEAGWEIGPSDAAGARAVLNPVYR